MSLYLTAFKAYHREPPGVDWACTLMAHFRTGWIISTPEAFIAARLVASFWPDTAVLDLALCQSPEKADMIHVWVAAGNLHAILELADKHCPPGVRWLSFQRRGYSVHRHRLQRVWEKVRSQNHLRPPRRQ